MGSNDCVRYLENLEQIRDRIDEKRDHYALVKDWNFDKDIRFLFLSQLYRLIMFYDIGIVDFIDNLFGERRVETLFKLTDNKSINEVLKDYFTFLKNAFVYSLSGIVENYFRSIFKVLYPDKNNLNDFYEIRLLVFEAVEIKQESDLWKALSVLSNIRNSIHNNGIHTGKSSKTKKIEIFYDGRSHKFIDSQAQTSADPKTLIRIVNHILDIIEMINEKEIISNIEIIPDPSNIK
jgi:hypothetical protein